MLFLVGKHVFYRLENNAKERPHIIEFLTSWNAKMKYTNGQSSKSRQENGITCLSTMFTPRVMVIAIIIVSKMGHFLYFHLFST